MKRSTYDFLSNLALNVAIVMACLATISKLLVMFKIIPA